VKISLVMIVKNEERSLGKCLKQAVHLVDEIVIADTGSDDETKAVAERFGARVYDYQWTNDFSAARNFALGHSTGEWNLVLDADEYLRPCTRTELAEMIEKNVVRWGNRWIGAITRYDQYQDGEGISVNVTAIPRLLPAGIRYTGKIHEQPDTDHPCYQIPLTADHDGYLQENKGERNLPYLEAAVKQFPHDMYYHFQMASTLRNLKRYQDSLKWFRTFYAGCLADPLQYGAEKNGYYIEGVILYLYTLLDIGDSKCLQDALEVINHERGRLGDRADFCFVCGLFYMKLVLSDVALYAHLLPEIEASYLKCLSIGESQEQGGVVGTGSFKAAYNLGLWYEVSGQTEKAKAYYRKSADFGYLPAQERLKNIFSE